MLTSGTLSGLQEFLASWIAHDRSKSGHYFTSRVPKMAVYGAFISAPLGHVLISLLQKIFQGRKSLKAKILQILVSNLIVSAIVTDIIRTGHVLTFADLPYSEQRLPHLHGNHRRRPNFPPSQGDCQGRFLARHEGQLDCLAHLARVCPAIPA